jgi:hypothetical protein
MRTWLAALATFAMAPAAIAEPARDKMTPAQTPVSATCDVVELWASWGGGKCDKAIPERICRRLERDFKFTEYKLLSKDTKTFSKKSPEKIKLAKGSATVTLVEIVDKSNVRLRIDFAAAPGKTDGTFTIAAGDWQTLVAKQSNDPKADAHILAVGNCK